MPSNKWIKNIWFIYTTDRTLLQDEILTLVTTWMGVEGGSQNKGSQEKGKSQLHSLAHSLAGYKAREQSTKTNPWLQITDLRSSKRGRIGLIRGRVSSQLQ